MRVTRTVRLEVNPTTDPRWAAWEGSFRLPAAPGEAGGPQWYSGKRRGERLVIHRQIPAWERWVWRPRNHVESSVEKVAEKEVQVVTRLVWHDSVILPLAALVLGTLATFRFLWGTAWLWGFLAMMYAFAGLPWLVGSRQIRRESLALTHALESQATAADTTTRPH
jgi:hypothetical protein